jgi:hypothetical protein
MSTSTVAATGTCKACRMPIVLAGRHWVDSEGMTNCDSVLTAVYAAHKPEPKPGVITPMPLARREMLAAYDRAIAALTADLEGWCGPCEESPEGQCFDHREDRAAADLLQAQHDALESGDTVKVAELLGMGETR